MEQDPLVQDFVELFDDTSGNFRKLESLGGIDGIFQKLEVSAQTGLQSSEIESRRQRYGSNELPERKYQSYFGLLFDALKDVTLLILLAAAVVSIPLGVIWPEEPDDKKTGWIEGASILLAVVIVSNVTAGNDYAKDKQFRLLEKEKDKQRVFVLRNGETIEIESPDLVIGDIVILERGNKIPADGLLFQGEDFRVDQSNLTGESDAIRKSREEPFLFSGCIVAEGEGRMIVLAVGVNSQYGRILVELEVEETKTPLQEQLDQLAARIGYVGLACGAAVFIAQSLWWVFDHFIKQDRDKFELQDLQEFIGFFITAVTIVVVAVPEGLPLAVTISLAYSMKKMMKDNNLVRHLKACETMGGVTNICTDKTGTLTENRMTVVDGWVAGKKT